MIQSRTRVGYHYYPDDHHFTESELEQWLPILDALGAGWITLRASLSRAVPEHFIRALIDAGIQPVIHMPARLGGATEPEVPSLMDRYARWGVRHVVIFDRPNLKSSWGTTSWSRHGLVERFLDQSLPYLQAMQSAGLQPVLPPLQPGGDYWDTAFLEASLLGLARRREHSLVQDMAIGTYAWTFGKQLDWGKGGPARWPEATPYYTPEGCQDQIGFRIFEWYSTISTRAVGKALPLLVIAGGELSTTDDAASVGTDEHAERNLSIARLLESDAVPENVIAFNFYLLASEPDDPEHGKAWFPSLDRPRPVVKAFRRYFGQSTEPSPATTRKPHDHYILLPRHTDTDFTALWADLARIVSANHATVGFSIEEAALARRVTLVDSAPGFSEGIYRQLKEAGCNVDRI